MNPLHASARDFEAQALRCLGLFEGFRHNRVRFGGSSAAILPPAVWRQLDGGQRSDCRRVTLQRLIYERFFCAGTRDDRPPSAGARRAHAQSRELIAALSAANAGTGSFEAGWEPVIVNGRLCMSDGKCVLDVGPAGETSATSLATPVAVHDGATEPSRVAIPNQLVARSPGFYLAVGNRNLEPDAQALLRVYFNSTPEGAVWLMGMLTRELNARGIAFQFKVYTDGPMTGRCDSAVLYFRPDALQAVSRILFDNEPRIRLSTAAGVPPFTLRLLPGVALAEDPADGQSFGSSRAALLAGALLRQERLPRDRRSPAGFLALLREEFASRGATLSAPYLRVAHVDPFAALATQPATQRGSARGPRPAAGTRGELDAACDAIARHLCATAVWSGDACTWLGPTLGDSPWPELPYEVLGADLYDGASGVAVFLASAWRHLRVERFAATARGAVRYAFAGAGRPPAGGGAAGAGMFTGWPGVCLAAGLVGDALSDERLVRTAAARALRLAQRDTQAGTLDLIDGLYGEIVALAQLARLGRSLRLHAQVRARVERLEAGAHAHEAVAGLRSRDEYGLAHGAHGRLLAMAAARAGAAAHDAVGRQAAAEFDRLSSTHAAHRIACDASAASTSWCRGAAGHLAAGCAAFGAAAAGRRDLARTRERIARSLLARLDDGIGDLGLCHGITGEAGVLAVTRAEGLQPGADGLCDTAVRAATDAVLALLSGARGLCTLGRFAHPSLMQGLSGVGLYLLEQSEPDAPTPLPLILTGELRPCMH